MSRTKPSSLTLALVAVIVAGVLSPAAILSVRAAEASPSPTAASVASPDGSPSASPDVVGAPAAPSPVPAQDLATVLAGMQRLCDLWTTEDASAAAGRAMRIDRQDEGPRSCTFRADSRRDANTLVAARVEVNEEASFEYGDETVDSFYDWLRLNFPDAEEVEIAGLPTLRLPVARGAGPARGWRGSQSFVFFDPNTVMLVGVTTPRGVDSEAAVLHIVQRAIERLAASPTSSPAPSASTPPPASAVPSASPGVGASDTPFVAGISGQAVEVVQEWNGRDWLDTLSPPPQLRRGLTRALSGQGRSLGDLQLRIMETAPSATVAIFEFQVEDGNMERLSRALLQVLPFGGERSRMDPAAVEGKHVIVLDDGGNDAYAYHRGDRLWLVWADEEDLGEIFGQLP